MDKKTKILIDMDIGDEIDDALALYLAMKMGYDIVGITTVFRNTVERARIAKNLLKKFGNGYESVPVYAGYGTPIGEAEREYPHTCGYSSEVDAEGLAPDSSCPEDAIDFIISACKKYESELTLVCIGPFTNIARVLERDPSAFDGINKVVIMGGAFFKQYADWNVMCDVVAADLMFKGAKNLECIGADVTHQLPLDKQNYDKLLTYSSSDAAAAHVRELFSLWQKENPDRIPALHDPLAVYYVDHPDVCGMKDQSITVITEGVARGITFNTDAYGKAYMNPDCQGVDLSKKIKVARTVKESEFMSAFMSCFE